MVYIVDFKKDHELADRIGLQEILHYSNIKYFRPMLEKRGMVVQVEDCRSQVDSIYQFVDYLGYPCLFISFSNPNRSYSEVNCPKIFISSIVKYPINHPSGLIRLITKNWLKKGIEQSLAGISFNKAMIEIIAQQTKKEIPLTFIPPPVWDTYQVLYNLDFLDKLGSNSISTNGHIIDTFLPGWRPNSIAYKLPLKRRILLIGQTLWRLNLRATINNLFQKKSVHYYPIKLDLKGIVYASILSPSKPFRNWRRLIKEFRMTFRDKEDVTLVIKMAGRIKRNTKRSAFRILKSKSFKCRIIIIQDHLPQDQYENLVRSTSYLINISNTQEIGTSQLEFMSAGKPAISPQYQEMTMLNPENTFIVPTDDNRKFSIKEQLQQSYETIINTPNRYRMMSQNAMRCMESYCSQAVVQPRFSEFLDEIETKLH